MLTDVQKRTLETIEAELDRIRRKTRGYKAVGGVVTRYGQSATVAEVANLKRYIARFEFLVLAADEIRGTTTNPRDASPPGGADK